MGDVIKTVTNVGNNALGVVDNVLGTRMSGSNAASRAADAQTAAAGQANDVTMSMYNQSRADMQPWREAGGAALSSLVNNDFMKDWQKDPGYEFRMAEGMKAINNSAAARGMYNSGAAMKALAKYGQDYASNEYNNAYNRQYSRLSGLAGIGSNAASTQANQAMTTGGQIANNYMGMGNAQGAAEIAQGNSLSSLLNTAAGVGTAYLLNSGNKDKNATFSDERLKTSVIEIDKADLEEMKKHLKAYAFKYKSDKYGTGDWVGVMAQDLEKSKLGKTLVFENEKGEKMIDIKKVLSMFLATMAEG